MAIPALKKISLEDINRMAADMVSDGYSEMWQGDTRLTREADGVITEWHVTHTHTNGKRVRVEIIK